MYNYQPGRPITGDSAWRKDSFNSSADFTVRIPADVIAELDTLSRDERFRAARYDQLELSQFSAPKLRAFMDTAVRPQIYYGRGFVLIDGIDASRYSVQELEKFYWLMGQPLGEAVSQSAAGDFLGHVEDRTPPGAKESARGYIGRRVLPLHTDGGDVMGLMCVRTSRSGGTTVMSSVHTIYNELLRTAPQLLPTLFRGYRYHRRGEQAEGAPILTPYFVPVFHDVGGMLSSHFVRSSIEVAARESGTALEGIELEALEAFDKAANSLDVRIEFDLQPGQVLLANNYTTLHARTEFEDHDEKERKRLMFRLWLLSHPRWNVPQELLVYENKSGRPGVDPKPGGSQASADYIHRYVGESAAMAHAQVKRRDTATSN